jgi:hypothetical protein
MPRKEQLSRLICATAISWHKNTVISTKSSKVKTQLDAMPDLPKKSMAGKINQANNGAIYPGRKETAPCAVPSKRGRHHPRQ